MAHETIHREAFLMRGLYSIPAFEPFASQLVQRLMDSHKDSSPLALSSTLLLTPNRRSIQSLENAFMAHSEGALILPTMMPIGEEEELVFAHDDETIATLDDDSLPPLEMPRSVFWLYQRIMHYGGQKGWSRARGMALAQQLQDFLQQLRVERASLENLSRDHDWSDYWQIIFSFLQVIGKDWDAMLKREQRCDPFVAREQGIRRRMALWRTQPPTHPVMIVGSTGSRPMTAELMAAVLQLPNGAVVLPGLDETLSDEEWFAIGENEPTHPQYNFVRLLHRLNKTRADVRTWTQEKNETRAHRYLLVQEAFRTKPHKVTASHPVCTVIEANHHHQEASVIVRLLLAHLAQRKHTVALVTHNATLNRLVDHGLRQRGWVAHNSFGNLLRQSPPMVFLRLIVEHVIARNALTHLAVMKHPLCAMGQLREHTLAAARQWEHDGAYQSKELSWLEDWNAMMKPLAAGTKHTVTEWAQRHWQVAVQLAQDHENSGDDVLRHGQAGRMVASRFDDIMRYGGDCGDGQITLAEYNEFFIHYMGRGRYHDYEQAHPRLFLWGALEARLQHSDVLIVGGMNEGSYPPAAHHSPWLNAAMQQQIGLPPPDWRVGRSAHDFIHSFSHDTVYLTYSLLNETGRCEPSRFITRLRHSGAGHIVELRADELEKDLAEGMHHTDAPAPFPSVSLRPKRISVSQVRQLMQDPYGYYASAILRLRKKQPLDDSMTPMRWGSLIHDILNRYVANASSDDSWETLQEVMEKTLIAEGLNHDLWRLIFKPQLEEVLRGFWKWQQHSLATGWQTVACEQKGTWMMDGMVDDIRLTARCDRLDTKDGRWRIIDYKTGGVPTQKSIGTAREPQWMVQELIARKNGFADVSVTSQQAVDLCCLQLKKRGHDGHLTTHDITVTQEYKHKLSIDACESQLTNFLRHYLCDKNASFVALGDKASKDYHHLMRRTEWRYD